MTGDADSKRARGRIGGDDKARFLGGLRSGERREDAAAAAGFTLAAFYGARRRDPAFAAAWAEALATSAAAERRIRAYLERDERRARGEVRIAGANRRFYQRRRRRNVRFDADAQAAFLACFAASCDTRAAAAAAGVHESTVHLRRRTDPAFAEAYAAALAQGYVVLEAEALRLRLAAQRELRAAVEAGWEIPPRNGEGDRPARPGGGAAAEGGGAAAEGGHGTRTPPRKTCPRCGTDLAASAADAEFDRIMKLLARWDRRPRGFDTRFTPGGRRQRWTFDAAIAELDRIMRGMGVPRRKLPLPPAEEGKGERER